MTKFEEHDGKLFRMLDKPTPLTPDAKMPCLVRLIQDDSPMGRHNKFAFSPLIKNNNPIIIDSIKENAVSIAFNHMVFHYSNFEIIGYPVADGSKEWALYQMMQGEMVRHKSYFMPNTHCAMNEKCQIIIFTTPSSMIDGGDVICHANDWLTSRQVDTMIDERTGWQIYVEPEQPKPLLADARVGDLCKHRNGDWSQIIDTNGTYILGQPIRTTLKDTKGINRNFCLSGTHFIMQFDGEYDIIHTEPLAPEGSAEWALQMLLLGKKVTKQHLHDSGNVYWCFCDRPRCVQEFNCGTLQIMVTPEIWVKTVDKCGWRIYAEPKPKFVAGSYVKINYANSDDEHYVVKESSVLDAIEISRLSDGKTEWFYEAGYDFIIPIPASEVILDFGNGIVGWIAHNGKHNIDVFSKDNCWLACLAVSMLTEPMKSLVLDLLKAQEEE